MRQFYLFKNRAGYYVVRFIDPITGVMMSSGKSTHVKDKIEATMIATKWLENGTPDAYSGSRSFQNKLSSGIDLQNIVSRLTDNEIDTLLSLIANRRGQAIQTVQPEAVLSASQISRNIVTESQKTPDEAVPEKVLPKKIVLKNRRNKPKVRVVVKTENVEKINKESGRTPLINYMLSFWDYEYICYHE